GGDRRTRGRNFGFTGYGGRTNLDIIPVDHKEPPEEAVGFSRWRNRALERLAIEKPPVIEYDLR
ncbi:MAG: hypothetical protein LC714_08555, partial [Actinobacteria bacterium]|nr:hypothetical protein [Actinomycetota bacterium]